jgi:hypothetical protein
MRGEKMSTTDVCRNHPRFQGDIFDRNLQIVEAVRRLADRKGCMATQLALGLLLQQGEDIVPILGAIPLGVSWRSHSARTRECGRGDRSALGGYAVRNRDPADTRMEARARVHVTSVASIGCT